MCAKLHAGVHVKAIELWLPLLGQQCLLPGEVRTASDAQGFLFTWGHCRASEDPVKQEISPHALDADLGHIFQHLLPVSPKEL